MSIGSVSFHSLNLFSSESLIVTVIVVSVLSGTSQLSLISYTTLMVRLTPTISLLFKVIVLCLIISMVCLVDDNERG